MKKILLLLATMLAFTACQRDAQPSIPEPDDASGKTRQVALDLEGDVSDPLNEFARALELEPGTSGGRSTLAPKFTDGEEVNALCAVSSQDGTKGDQTLRSIKLKVSGGGKKLTYKGTIQVSDEVGDQIHLSVFIGFNGSSTTKPLEEYPSMAPYYAETGARTTITNFPIALQAKGDLSATTIGDQKYYKNEAMRFRLVGSLIRCRIVNETDEPLTITGLKLHGLGATGLKLARTESNKEYFATSDNTDPASSTRVYQLPSPLTIQKGTKAGYYLVYAPLVSKQDGKGVDYKGYILPVFSDPALQTKYVLDDTPKVLSEDKSGKLPLATIRISTSPIHANAIPLQYWNYNMYYTQNGQNVVVSGAARPGLRFPLLDGYEARPYWNDWPMGKPKKDPFGIFFRTNAVTHDQIKGLTSGGKAMNLHIPTVEEIAGIFPPDLIPSDALNNDHNNHPVYYRSTAVYTAKKVETVEVAGRRLAGQSSFYRAPIEGSMDADLLNVILGQGNLGPHQPIYALRFGKPTAEEIQAFKAQGGSESLLVKDNRSRVAYMYSFELGRLLIRSCYIGENSEIMTAQDLATKNVFGSGPSSYTETFGGRSIVVRYFRLYPVAYSTPAVSSGYLQYPCVTRKKMPAGTPFATAYPSSVVPAKYGETAQLLSPPSGILCRTSSTDNTIIGHWLTRTNEKYSITSTDKPLYGYHYETDATRARSYIKDLPEDGTHYFAFPLVLFSNYPSAPMIGGESDRFVVK